MLLLVLLLEVPVSVEFDMEAVVALLVVSTSRVRALPLRWLRARRTMFSFSCFLFVKWVFVLFV
jgi:hypothetical protein